MLLVHVACPFWMPILHVNAAWLCFISMPMTMSPCCMYILHSCALFPCFMSTLPVHASCPCCVNILNERAAWACCLNRNIIWTKKWTSKCCMSSLHVDSVAKTACPCFMSRLHVMSPCCVNVHPACPSHMSILHVHVHANAACPYFISMFHIHISMLLAYSGCPCCSSMLHVLIAWTCSMNLLHEHVAWTWLWTCKLVFYSIILEADLNHRVVHSPFYNVIKSYFLHFHRNIREFLLLFCYAEFSTTVGYQEEYNSEKKKNIQEWKMKTGIRQV